MANGEFWILALSGGGARGLFTAKLLEKLEHELGGQPLARRFDLIAGTSIGGILALGVAKEIPTSQLVSLFDHSKEIFRPRIPIMNWPFYRARYHQKKLNEILSKAEVFGDAVIGDLKHRVVIPSVNYTKGTPSFFKTPHHSSLKTDWKLKLVDVALATSAAPTFFPVHEFNHQHFVDGGLVANAPGLIAVHEAMHFANHPDVSTIHVVSIGTCGGGTAMDPGVCNDMGIVLAKRRNSILPSWGWGPRIFELVINSQEAMSNFMLTHWLKEQHHLIDADPKRKQSDYLALDNVSDEARNTLLGQAELVAQEMIAPDLVNFLLEHNPAPSIFYYGPNKNTTQ